MIEQEVDHSQKQSSLRASYQFSTKTCYEQSFRAEEWAEVGGQGKEPKPIAETFLPKCQLVQINALIRHGIRSADFKDVKRVGILFKKISSRLSAAAVDVHQQLTERFLAVEENSLLQEGHAEQERLATRILTKHNGFISSSSSDDFLFMSSSSPRAIDSFIGFRKALHPLQRLNNNNKSDNIDNESSDNTDELDIRDDILRFKDYYRTSHMIHEAVTRIAFEYLSFKDEVVRYVASALQTRLGLLNESISYGELRALYVYAGLEVVLLGTSHLADLFTLEEITRLEYASDLKCYWKKSYGNSLNYQLYWPLLKNMFYQMDNAVQNKRFYKAIFRFAHTESVLPLVTLLGLFKDPEDLRVDNYPAQDQRRFRTGRICPFSANVFFLLYKGPHKENSDGSVSHNTDPEKDCFYVKLLVNEIPTHFPDHVGDRSAQCYKEYLYPYDEIRSYYENSINGIF